MIDVETMPEYFYIWTETIRVVDTTTIDKYNYPIVFKEV